MLSKINNEPPKDTNRNNNISKENKHVTTSTHVLKRRRMAPTRIAIDRNGQDMRWNKNFGAG
jgi:hypothetical protein